MPRLVIPGEVHHVLQRGHNRQTIFHDAEDAQALLAALREASQLHDLKVHAYALMPTHLHLLATPGTSVGLARTMQTLGRRYVGHFNRRHGRTGTLWEGRFRTTVIEAAAFFETMMLYVEQNPLRGGLVECAGDYPWSSAAHHLGQRRDPLIAEHAAFWALGNTPFDRELRVRKGLLAPQDTQVLARVRRHVHSGWPLMTPRQAAVWEAQLQRPLTPQPVGRPRLDSVPNK
ncbi:REP-associated tyrosine transposase [Inhella gelatinilytica]|uniref:Transposase n=1 Tax=Inhella gelatinilytica TaxID=2795030 RepID=A0A931IZ17_9BURK|nr:transposase [Inhella gelatinilytica]MBH9552436.1 transposase [Inhella gelatinilytica]